MFCMITSLAVLPTETSIDFCNQLITSSSSSSVDSSTSFSSTPNPRSFQPAVTISLELICHHFHQLGNTSFFQLEITTLPAVGTALSFMGPEVPSLTVLLASLGSRPWLFFFLRVHVARVSSNLQLTPWVFHRRFW